MLQLPNWVEMLVALGYDHIVAGRSEVAWRVTSEKERKASRAARRALKAAGGKPSSSADAVSVRIFALRSLPSLV